MKTTYIFLAFIGLLMYNVFLIQRDQRMFEGYDSAIQRLKQSPEVIK